MASGTSKYPIRLSDADRQLLAEITEHHALDNGADMIRRLIRQEWRRVQVEKTAAPETAAPSSFGWDNLPPDED